MNRSKLFVLGLIGVLLVAVGIGASTAVGLTPSPIASAFEGSSGQVGNAADNRNLADAVTGWNKEHPKTGPGNPILSKSTDLLAGVGTKADTLSAFPTSRGAVCYQILAAGTCGKLDTPSGITFSILSIRDRGTRLFGVASDQVSRVQVVVDETTRDAILRKNGFYYQLPDGSDGSEVQRVISTLVDGSTYTVSVHE
jgi:hypothetical protein